MSDGGWGAHSDSNHGDVHGESNGEGREFFISVQVYISNKTATAMRKPNARKKTEKRDGQGSRPLSLLTDDRKVKEKSSWLSLARPSSTWEHWRQATCRLTEEGETCILNVYMDEMILYQCVYIHLLHHTDIRAVDRSLFSVDHCLGIHCASARRWTLGTPNEPLYFQFSSSEALNTWISLLRSYAVPEIYGRDPNSRDGGMYRIWRQVELKCIQARNIGSARSLDENPPNSPLPGDNINDSGRGGHGGGGGGGGDSDAVTDLDLYCEIYLNKTLSGRTVVKKSLGAPEWHENFLFRDLPYLEDLTIKLRREKKLLKPATVGTVYIVLTNFRRGELVDGWFPVLYGGSATASTQVGQIRLKLRVDEEIVLPLSAYSSLQYTLNSRNYLDWMSDLEQTLKLKHLSQELVSLAVAKDTLLDSIFELADREVDGTPSSHTTLFRGNTTLTKTVELAMNWYGKSFLEASVGDTIRKLCSESIAIEVDPIRNGKGAREVERHVDLLVHWCREVWEKIYAARYGCPQEMRRLFEHVRQLVEKRYKGHQDSAEQKRELPWQSVSAFIFLRFIVPAILHPHLFGLCAGMPDPPVQRTLTLIAKVIQSLANLNISVQKEDFMRGLKTFLTESQPSMVDYILVVSTPDPPPLSTQTSADLHDRRGAVQALESRRHTMPTLHQDSIPQLPFLTDPPKDLAVLSSAILRQTRVIQVLPDSRLHDLVNACTRLEQQALRRVTRLAATLDASHRQQQLQLSLAATTPAHVHNHGHHQPPPPLRLLTVLDKSPPSKRSASPRPMTAPSPSPSRHAFTSSSHEGPLPSSSSNSNSNSHSRGFSSSQVDVSSRQLPTPIEESSRSMEGGGGSWPLRKRLIPSHPRSISTDSITMFKPPTPSPLSPPLSGDADDDTSKRRKGFFRGIMTRK